MKTLKFLDKHLEEFIMVLLLSSIVVIMLFQIIRQIHFQRFPELVRRVLPLLFHLDDVCRIFIQRTPWF